MKKDDKEDTDDNAEEEEIKMKRGIKRRKGTV
jgi:hypothetical protein